MINYSLSTLVLPLREGRHILIGTTLEDALQFRRILR